MVEHGSVEKKFCVRLLLNLSDKCSNGERFNSRLACRTLPVFAIDIIKCCSRIKRFQLSMVAFSIDVYGWVALIIHIIVICTSSFVSCNTPLCYIYF